VPLRSSNKLVYIAIDDLISTSGKPLTGFPEFLEGLEEANLPCVWISSRNRHELDSAIRKLGHAAPFIAEGGSGVYLPEDYFHLKPARTIRFARFTVIPVATPQPAAAEALDQLAEDTGIEAVALRTLSPRELSQNVGLPQREAELLRQRDFDELFFFAGATDAEIQKFQAEAAHRNLQLRPRGNLWSLVVGASLATCIRQLTALYERAIRAHPFTIALATSEEARELFPCCNRAILLTDRSSASSDADSSARISLLSLPLFAPHTWESALESILAKRV
jgi:predicted mannosyl-3-phosphoglycerate phosphatase (HAD superfamily)